MLSPPPASATSRRALPLLSALLGALLLVLLPISVTLLASSNPSRVQLPTEKSDVVEINSGWYTIEQFDDPEYCIRGDASYVYHMSFEACNAKPYLEFVSRVNVEGFDRPYSWSATCDADGLHQSVYEYEGDCDDPLTVLDPGCTWPPPEQTCAVPLTATETATDIDSSECTRSPITGACLYVVWDGAVIDIPYDTCMTCDDEVDTGPSPYKELAARPYTHNFCRHLETDGPIPDAPYYHTFRAFKLRSCGVYPRVEAFLADPVVTGDTSLTTTNVPAGFASGDSIRIGDWPDTETATIAAVTRPPGYGPDHDFVNGYAGIQWPYPPPSPAPPGGYEGTITVASPLIFDHPAGTRVSRLLVALTAGENTDYAPLCQNSPFYTTECRLSSLAIGLIVGAAVGGGIVTLILIAIACKCALSDKAAAAAPKAASAATPAASGRASACSTTQRMTAAST